MDQTFWTVLAGVSVFVLGQVVQNFLLKPIQDLKKVIGEISHKVKFHSNILTNSRMPEEKIRWAADDMRDLSCQLESRYVLIPLSGFFGHLRIIPSRANITKAAKDLIFLSNAGGSENFIEKNDEAINSLKRSLKIEL